MWLKFKVARFRSKYRVDVHSFVTARSFVAGKR